jgi:hypothetical protein
MESKTFFSIFGKIFDFAADGSNYDMSGKYKCTKCGSSNVSYGPTVPPVFWEGELPFVTHKMWDKMSDEKKQQLLFMYIKEMLNNSEIFPAPSNEVPPQTGATQIVEHGQPTDTTKENGKSVTERDGGNKGSDEK